LVFHSTGTRIPLLGEKAPQYLGSRSDRAAGIEPLVFEVELNRQVQGLDSGNISSRRHNAR
jgi:hypothetical protein